MFDWDGGWTGPRLLVLDRLVGTWSMRLRLGELMSMSELCAFGTEKDYITRPFLESLNSFWRSFNSSITRCFFKLSCSFINFTCTCNYTFCFYLTLKYSSSSSILDKVCILCSYFSWWNWSISICFYSRFESLMNLRWSKYSYFNCFSWFELCSFVNIFTASLFFLYYSRSVTVY